MIEESQMSEIEARLRDVADVEVTMASRSDGGLQLNATVGGASLDLRVMRDLHPAAKNDVTFVGNAFADVRRLMGTVRSGGRMEASALEAIKDRVAATSPAPWFAFIESDGGQGGCDVIRVTEDDDEPDMYLWLGDDLAPSRVFRFVAGARQDIPALVETIETGEAW